MLRGILVFYISCSANAFVHIHEPAAFRGKVDRTVLNSFSYQNGDLSRQANPMAEYYAPSSAGPSSPPDAPQPIEAAGPSLKNTNEIWPYLNIVHVQGGSLRTCAFDEGIERMQVILRTEGRPLNANVELWQGPDNAPQRMQVYLEDGSLRPFRAVIETPGDSNAIAIRNTGELEFPLEAGIDHTIVGSIDHGSPAASLGEMSKPRTVQGGAVYTVPFAVAVQSVQLAMTTDGRPLNARIELLQGPNNNKQVLEIYSEDGLERPLYVVLDTPGAGNVIRIVNTATVEFPLFASLEPYLVEEVIKDDSTIIPNMVWT